MNIQKLFDKIEVPKPYRYTLEQQEDLLRLLNARTACANQNMKSVDTAYVELENGTRFSIKSRYSSPIFELRDLESRCIEFVTESNKELSHYEVVYVREPWRIQYVSSSHLDPSTFDYLETPTAGYWTIYGRFRGLTAEDLNSASQEAIEE